MISGILLDTAGAGGAGEGGEGGGHGKWLPISTAVAMGSTSQQEATNASIAGGGVSGKKELPPVALSAGSAGADSKEVAAASLAVEFLVST